MPPASTPLKVGDSISVLTAVWGEAYAHSQHGDKEWKTGRTFGTVLRKEGAKWVCDFAENDGKHVAWERKVEKQFEKRAPAPAPAKAAATAAAVFEFLAARPDGSLVPYTLAQDPQPHTRLSTTRWSSHGCKRRCTLLYWGDVLRISKSTDRVCLWSLILMHIIFLSLVSS